MSKRQLSTQGLRKTNEEFNNSKFNSLKIHLIIKNAWFGITDFLTNNMLSLSPYGFSTPFIKPAL